MTELAVVKFTAEDMQSKIEEFPPRSEENDEPESVNFGWYYIICLLFSIATYALDITIHCWIAYLYHYYGHVTNFILTVIFIILPALITTAFSLRWYVIDVDEPSISRAPIWKWILRVIVLIFQIAPILRYFDALVYGVQSKRSRSSDGILHVDSYYRRMLDEDSDAALLRLFHCFLFAAPQAIIQLTALVMAATVRVGPIMQLTVIQEFQLLGVLCCFVSIAWSIASYQRSVRFARDDKKNLTWLGTTLQFFWHLSIAVSRVLALSLLASFYPTWMLAICIIHWIVMSIWLLLSNSQATVCSSWCEELTVSIMLGFAYILTYISHRDGPTRYTYLIYYLGCFMENTAALLVWCVGVEPHKDPFLYYGAVATQVCTFFFGIFLMLLYYRWFHPAHVSCFNDSVIRKPRREKWIESMTDYS